MIAVNERESNLPLAVAVLASVLVHLGAVALGVTLGRNVQGLPISSGSSVQSQDAAVTEEAAKNKAAAQKGVYAKLWPFRDTAPAAASAQGQPLADAAVDEALKPVKKRTERQAAEKIRLGSDNGTQAATVAWISYDDFRQLEGIAGKTVQPALQMKAQPVEGGSLETFDPTPPARRAGGGGQPGQGAKNFEVERGATGNSGTNEGEGGRGGKAGVSPVAGGNGPAEATPGSRPRLTRAAPPKTGSALPPDGTNGQSSVPSVQRPEPAAEAGKVGRLEELAKGNTGPQAAQVARPAIAGVGGPPLLNPPEAKSAEASVPAPVASSPSSPAVPVSSMVKKAAGDPGAPGLPQQAAPVTAAAPTGLRGHAISADGWATVGAGDASAAGSWGRIQSTQGRGIGPGPCDIWNPGIPGNPGAPSSKSEIGNRQSTISPGNGGSPNLPPGPPGEPSNPTGAPRADKESEPVCLTSIREHVSPCGVLTQEGIEIKTVHPRFSPVELASSLPDNIEATLTFSKDGTVIDVHLDQKSGYNDIDAAVTESLYMWKATGRRVEALHHSFTVPFTIILSGQD